MAVRQGIAGANDGEHPVGHAGREHGVQKDAAIGRGSVTDKAQRRQAATALRLR